MKLKVHSVTFEQKDPTFKDFLKAAFAYATFRPAVARAHMSGEQWLWAKNEAGEKIAGIGGGSSMTIFTGNDEKSEALNQQAHPECKMNKGGFKL